KIGDAGNSGIFYRAPVNVLVLFGAAIKDSAVAGVANLPVDLQLEIAELLFADDVLNASFFRQRAVADGPPCGDRGGLVPAPSIQGLSVKQRLPSGCALRADRLARKN